MLFIMKNSFSPSPILVALTIMMCLNSFHCLDIIVSNDGSGNFMSIGEAVASIPDDSNQRTVVKIKAGTYIENVIVGQKKIKVSFIGEGINRTIIKSDRSNAKNFSTSDSATVAVLGEDFFATGITFINSAGADERQAVALRSVSSRSAFFRCSFEGYQDTLYTQAQPQFYRECDVYGTVDFIFGHANVILQNCNIYARIPQPGQSNTITADGTDKYPSKSPSGIVLHNCTITGILDLKATNKSSQVKSFLGRPWRDYSTTVIMQSYIDDIISPEGWLAWGGRGPTLTTIFYREYGNRGPGSNTSNRVKWAGYKALTNPADVLNFTVQKFIDGSSWIPQLGIPYIPGFI